MAEPADAEDRGQVGRRVPATLIAL